MGMAFLDETETLSNKRYRLEPRLSLGGEPFENCSINNPTRRLLCIAATEPVLANADTGSEIDLLSLAYCQKRNFVVAPINRDESQVQFADGSVSHLVGAVDMTIIIGHVNGIRFKVKFYVLEDLTCDLLLGEDILNETDAFRTYENAFSIENDGDSVAEVNTIVWFNTFERFLTRFTRGDGGTTAPAPLSGKSYPLYGLFDQLSTSLH